MSLDGSFRLMSLPLELRRFVYKYALIAPAIQQGEEPNDSDPGPVLVFRRDLSYVPAPALVRVSKQVNLEATDILYACNTFTTRHLPMAKLRDPRQGEKRIRPWVDRSGNCHPVIIDAVSKVFELDKKSVSRWLALKRPRSNQLHDFAKLLHMTPGNIRFEGLVLTGFLRAIGHLNARMITRIELHIGLIAEAVDILVVYAEVLKQHMTGLQNVVIVNIADFGDFYSIYRFEDEATAQYGVKGYVYQATNMMPLFYVLESLIKELPQLRQLELRDCSPEMEAMAAALMDAKRESIPLDVPQQWSMLLREAKERGHDFPTCIGDDLSPHDMDDNRTYSAWKDITLLEEAHHGRLKVDPYL
ncbi:MAG: hypothetical protein Q9207_002186 [Kuettlingeria erythrocarpa]